MRGTQIRSKSHGESFNLDRDTANLVRHKVTKNETALHRSTDIDAGSGGSGFASVGVILAQARKASYRNYSASSVWSLNEVDDLMKRTLSAIAKTSIPIKLTFSDLTYTVKVPNTKE